METENNDVNKKVKIQGLHLIKAPQTITKNKSSSTSYKQGSKVDSRQTSESKTEER